MPTHFLTLRFDETYEASFAVSGSLTLHELAMFLVDTLEFDFDHAFGFFDNLKNPYKSREKYSLFADLGEAEEGDLGVMTPTVAEVFPPKKEMLFLFDFGDDWMFQLKCTGVEEAKSSRIVQKLLSAKGKPPEQYPDYDEE